MTTLNKPFRPAPLKVITDFDFGNYRWLSNFYPCKVQYRGLTFHTTEAAYQAQKSLNPDVVKEFSKIKSPGEAKGAGQRLKMRPDWNEVRVGVMKDLIDIKFYALGSLAEKLTGTGDTVLIEGNTWDDHFWGVCRGWGRNELGIILMERRRHLLGIEE